MYCIQEGDVKAARDLYSQSLLMYPLRTEDPASAKEYSVILANRDWQNSGINMIFSMTSSGLNFSSLRRKV